ncbi:MAG TPA: bifunctional phosphopantothenoylcysteine decarboxylase/phosphopantothenate--cysteine ligase CoaBC [Gaiellaceae bacterium]|nr:bifunctional phosphopantothenoylcysteine decarboxylase/phosphopantothenate--cysteine ligase CoaBC [Gaiellaceae bacterium]
MARVILGVTGGIAAYKACELCRLLVKGGHEVTPLLTPGAERFVTAQTFEALARREQPRQLYPHLVEADLLVIAPLSANTLAKLAHGLADNVLTELALAFRGPVLAAPAMNVRMWEQPATQANAALLRERGVHVIGPEAGELAEGETGVGRMSEPETIYARCRELLGESDALAGKTVLVTAGGTREPLDSVRFLGNRSSGRMGVELAAEARRRGARVTMLAANLAVPAPGGVDVVLTPTAADMAREAKARADADVVLMAAAVADYAPEATSGKRPKSAEPWQVRLNPTEDILRSLAAAKNGTLLVGFGAEEGEEGLDRKRRMLVDKGLDLVVFNDVSRSDIGFDAPENEVVLISAAGEQRVERSPKRQVAAAILDEVERLLQP